MAVALLHSDAAGLARLVDLLREGRVVGFPTDTVYGLAALVSEPGALRQVFEIKGRPRGRPLILMVPEAAQVSDLAEVGERAGITFCFAAAFHPALRNAAVPRRELGVPTTFNLLGPLANPGDPSAQAVGVADGRVAGLMAGVLARRGIDALVFHGDDGLDELTTADTSTVWVVHDGEVGQTVLDPTVLGLAMSKPGWTRFASPCRSKLRWRRIFLQPWTWCVITESASGMRCSAPPPTALASDIS